MILPNVRGKLVFDGPRFVLCLFLLTIMLIIYGPVVGVWDRISYQYRILFKIYSNGCIYHLNT